LGLFFVDVKEILNARKEKVMPFVLANIPDRPSPGLTNMMKEYPARGGKYLRPALVLLVCEALGGDPDKAVRTAGALEMFQDWVLIHDDIEDDSEDRRGKPCLHLTHGMPLALNAGDALHLVMWDTLIKNRESLGDDLTFDVLNEFFNILMHTVDGQTFELTWLHENDWSISEEDYFNMIYNKTSWYTIMGPCRLGALLAGDKNLDRFNAFGEYLGKAFQIQDDILNLVGDEAKYGKEIGGDIQEGKRTLILIHLLNACSDEEKKKVVGIMDRPRAEISAEDVKTVIALMKEKGSIDYAIKVAKDFAENARVELPNLNLPDNKAAQELQAIIGFVIDREL